MSENRFEVGDLARVRDDANNHTFYNDIHKGDIARVIRVNGGETYKYRLRTDDGREETFRDEQLDLVARDLDHLRAGDIVLDADNDERRVIDVLPNSVLLSVYGAADDLDTANTWFTPGELKRKSFTLKQDTPADVTELTLEDIAKLKGVDVSQIKIVEK